MFEDVILIVSVPRQEALSSAVSEKDAHLAWLEVSPSKRPKEAEARRQVSVFYSGGSVCDLTTGEPWQMEVKLKCKAAEICVHPIT